MRIGDSTKKAVHRLYRSKQGESAKKVDDKIALEKRTSSPAAAGAAGGSGAGAPAGKAGLYEARLGLEERKYEVAAEAVAKVPDIRPEKAARIEELRTMIANGTYKVDADELAKRLLQSGLFDDLA